MQGAPYKYGLFEILTRLGKKIEEYIKTGNEKVDNL